MHAEVRCSRSPSTKCLEEDVGYQMCKSKPLRRRTVFPDFHCHASIFSGRLGMRPLHKTCRFVIKMKNRRRVGRVDGGCHKKKKMWHSLYFHSRFSFPVETPKKNLVNVQPRWETRSCWFQLGNRKKSTRRNSWSSTHQGSFQGEFCPVNLPLSFPHRWVREFLNEDNKGLDVLVEYLSFAQYAVT